MSVSKYNKNGLKDFEVNIKLKLAALWASVTFFYIYGDYFELYVPNKIAGMINGTSMLDNSIKVLLASFLLAIPALMICLSLLLKPPLNKWLNIVFSIFFTVMMLLIAAISISKWRAFYVFYAIAESILTSLIVWYSFKWPKQAEFNH
jgi:Family of unknown function (DUF6326)